MEIAKEFKFEAAHQLHGLRPDHPCARVHGHSYRARVVVRGPLHPTLRWVMDFGDVKAACQPVFDRLDHAFLNEIPGLEQPTAEQIAIWLWRQIKPRLPELARVELFETATSTVIYTGEFEGDAGTPAPGTASPSTPR